MTTSTGKTDAEKIERLEREVGELKHLLAQRTRAWREVQRITRLRRK